MKDLTNHVVLPVEDKAGNVTHLLFGHLTADGKLTIDSSFNTDPKENRTATLQKLAVEDQITLDLKGGPLNQQSVNKIREAIKNNTIAMERARFSDALAQATNPEFTTPKGYESTSPLTPIDPKILLAKSSGGRGGSDT